MKLSSKILLAGGLVLLAGMLSSNLVLKSKYDKLDKSDHYWSFEKIETRPFKYLKLNGGNIAHIAFEQGKDCSVRILEDWQRYHRGHVDVDVENDTLYLNFDFVPKDNFEKDWMKYNTVVRIFSPELRSIQGTNTHFEMYLMKQRSYSINLTGKSFLEIESMVRNLDALDVSLKDSAQVVFEMSPEYAAAKKEVVGPGVEKEYPITNKEAMTLHSLVANIQGLSLLDIGHAQIDTISLAVSDSSAIILSGGALRKMTMEK